LIYRSTSMERRFKKRSGRRWSGFLMEKQKATDRLQKN